MDKGSKITPRARIAVHVCREIPLSLAIAAAAASAEGTAMRGQTREEVHKKAHLEIRAESSRVNQVVRKRMRAMVTTCKGVIGLC